MLFKIGDKIEFSDSAGWQNGTIVQINDMHGEYLIRHGQIEIWISAHRCQPPRFSRELANKIRGGRAVGNLYVVTQRSLGLSGIIASFASKEERETFIECAMRSDFENTGLIFPTVN